MTLSVANVSREIGRTVYTIIVTETSCKAGTVIEITSGVWGKGENATYITRDRYGMLADGTALGRPLIDAVLHYQEWAASK